MLEVMIVFWVAITGNSVKKNTLKASVTSIVELEGALINCFFINKLLGLGLTSNKLYRFAMFNPISTSQGLNQPL